MGKVKKEKSAGVVVFCQDKFLLLYYPSLSSKKQNYWDFPKGHIEENEDELITALRETKEETGLRVKIIPGFREKIKYFFKQNNQLIFKEVVFFLGEAKSKKVSLSDEHLDYCWLEYPEALKKLKFKNTKEVLKKAFNFLKAKNYL